MSGELTKGLDGLRIAVAGGYFKRQALDDALAAVTLAARALETSREIVLPEAERARAAAYLITMSEGGNLHLPDLNGWEVFSQLRSAETTRNIPVIVISADATPRQVQQFMSAGARDYLTKPLDVTKFSRVIEESAWPSTDFKTLIQKQNEDPLASVIS